MASEQTANPLKKVALITGASSGMGRLTALTLAKASWDVVIAARRESELQEVAKEAEQYGGKIVYVVVDVSIESDVRALFQTVREQFGRLDLLFNNAGVATPGIPIEDMDPAMFLKVFSINVTGVWLCTQEAVRIMKSQVPMGGRIINNGSMSAHAPRPNSVPYTMSKHAINGLTKCVALDGRPYNIACSQIDVGNANTAMGGRMGGGVTQADGSKKVEPTYDPQHVADAILFIASLPLHVNVLNINLMATNMPFVGRG